MMSELPPEYKLKSTRGGKRREGITQTHTGFKINNDLADRLKLVKNKNRFVNEAIKEKFERQ